MRIVVVATKCPWPLQDGGRLALWLTLQGLAAAGHSIWLIAPVASSAEASALASAPELTAVCKPILVPARPHSWWRAALRSLRTGRALTVERHALEEVAAAVAECVRVVQPALIHVEQLQAYANCQGGAAKRVPKLLRMQNVESDLWRQMAGGGRLWFRYECRRLQRDEYRALDDAAEVVALTNADRDLLEGQLRNARRVGAIPPPFPEVLPAAPAREGQPAVVVFGSSDWRPNQDAVRWFMEHVAPPLLAQNPTATVHLYGHNEWVGPREGPAFRLFRHPAPGDATDAFPAGAVMALPLRIGSGIRMRILEAWARGLPVVASPVAVSGLDVRNGEELLIATSANEFVDALLRLSDPDLRAQLVDAGRAYLRRFHSEAACTTALLARYQSVARMHA